MWHARCWLVSGALALLPLGGCGAVGGMVSAAGALFDQQAEGNHAEVFVHPLKEVQPAVLQALERIGVTDVRSEADGDGERIVGKTRERDVEVRLKRLTAEATRVSVHVGGLMSPGGAMAEEVIEQTRRALARA